MKKAPPVLFVLAVLALGYASIKIVSFNVNILDLLPGEIPEVQALNIFMDDFGIDGELFVTLESDDALLNEDAAASLSEHLTGIDGLVGHLAWQPVWISSPDTVAELPAYLWLNGEPAHLETLAARLAPGALEQTLTDRYEELATGIDSDDLGMLGYDPLGFLKPGAPDGGDFENSGIGRGEAQFANEDGTFRCIYIEPPEDVTHFRRKGRWLVKLKAVVDEWRPTFDGAEEVTIRFTGEPAFQAEIGGGMQHDMSGSITITGGLILVIFWLMHRRLIPLFWIAILLVLILSLTVLCGKALFGELSVMSVGFAAILIGLAVDYAVVIYQEASQHNLRDHRTIRRILRPSILWAAITTAAVFVSLNFSSLPGITQLGTLVAIGIVLGAVSMLGIFSRAAAATIRDEAKVTLEEYKPHRSSRFVLIVSILILPAAAIGILAWKGLPPLYTEADALRPRQSEADDAMDNMMKRLSPESPWRLPVIITADSVEEMADKILRVEAELTAAEESGLVLGHVLFPNIWANAEHQAANRTVIEASILPRRDAILKALDDAGFAEDPVNLVTSLFDAWDAFVEDTAEFVWPKSEASKRLLRGFLNTGPERFTMLGFVDPAPETEVEVASRILEEEGAYITGWRTLGPVIRPFVAHDIFKVFIPMAVVLVGMLVVVFRRWQGTLLSLGCLALSALILLAVMALFGLEWNFLNVTAFPLLLGTGIDYSIHMILALRREKGDLRMIHRGIARALVFCGISTTIAFGSLAFASNAGLASLGRVCCLGIITTMLTAILFLPHWWLRLHAHDHNKEPS